MQNTKIKDNLEQHKEIVTALKEKSKNLEEYNINLVNQKHQIEETLKITENNFNITKQDLEYFEKNFQQSETLNEHNYSQEIRILTTKQNISAKENNFNEKDATASQDFIIEKEINTNTNTLPENRSPNNNLVSTEGHQSNPNETTTVIKINVPRRAIGWLTGKKGKQINYLQEQNKVKISTALKKTDYQDIAITGNQEDIEKLIHSISKIILCKNFPTDHC